ncbi:hypothetical protein HZS_941, partial [Henneguya salminicola]
MEPDRFYSGKRNFLHLNETSTEFNSNNTSFLEEIENKNETKLIPIEKQFTPIKKIETQDITIISSEDEPIIPSLSCSIDLFEKNEDFSFSVYFLREQSTEIAKHRRVKFKFKSFVHMLWTKSFSVQKICSSNNHSHNYLREYFIGIFPQIHTDINKQLCIFKNIIKVGIISMVFTSQFTHIETEHLQAIFQGIPFKIMDGLDYKNKIYILHTFLHLKISYLFIPICRIAVNPDTCVILEYSPKCVAARIQITIADLITLQPETYLNDTIIDFYLRFIKDRALLPQYQSKIHMFTSFFYEKMKNGFDQDLIKWLGSIDIFQKDFLIFPINAYLHWSLVVICHPRHIISEDPRDADKVANILLFDSLITRPLDHHLFKIFAKFLQWLISLATTKNATENHNQRISFSSPKLLKQSNTKDCG